MKLLRRYLIFFSLFLTFCSYFILFQSNLVVHYAIVIDAGSSGTRMELYQWTRYDLNKLPNIIRTPDCQAQITPGISAFADGLDGLHAYFYRLFEMMEYCIEKRSVPVYLMATAGMRLLAPNKQQAILDECSRVLSILGYPVHRVQVISGDREGAFGWLALNYLFQRLGTNFTTYGVLDLGGASFQIAFEPIFPMQPDSESLGRLTFIKLRVSPTKTLSFGIFVKTFLGYGANEFLKKYRERFGGKGPDPCMLLGSQDEFIEKEAVGKGDLRSCLKRVEALVQEKCHDKCFHEEIPTINYSLQQFYGLSEFWYTTNDLFQTNGYYEYGSFFQLAENYCAFNLDSLLKQMETEISAGSISYERIQYQCFKSAYVMSLLHTGLNVPKSGNSIKCISTKNQQPVSWTLGALLYELCGEGQEKKD